MLSSAMAREHQLHVPQGKYYLVNAGFALKSGFLTPYRSTRYHLKEWGAYQPENPKELFNLRHASLRNAVERIFGVLKKWFPLLVSEQHYPFKTQVKFVSACCILHNHVMGVDPYDRIMSKYDHDAAEGAEIDADDREVVDDVVDDIQVFQPSQHISRNESVREGHRLREEIANQMWADYWLAQSRHRH
ncbi:PREDICTED: uncharacterized protein LOC104613038 [Nelumbo nucifera]|uniref:Uncharacterized protein LOC104613038 n=1 Tax=Nelumbo nucifera TaxID=4432 RepID=A0A1U8QCF4_NELNU|nr:PREDICTED: uncharacterized protein LOC104613038 [Nelumbo nucifera]